MFKSVLHKPRNIKTKEMSTLTVDNVPSHIPSRRRRMGSGDLGGSVSESRALSAGGVTLRSVGKWLHQSPGLQHSKLAHSRRCDFLKKEWTIKSLQDEIHWNVYVWWNTLMLYDFMRIQKPITYHNGFKIGSIFFKHPVYQVLNLHLA